MTMKEEKDAWDSNLIRISYTLNSEGITFLEVTPDKRKLIYVCLFTGIKPPVLSRKGSKLY